MMYYFCFLSLAIISFAKNVQCGQNDNLLQLEVAFGNLDLNSVYEQVEVPKVLYGGSVGVPADIEGSFIRHGCGVFGHALDIEIPNKPLDRIKHVFDCIPVAQAFHFHNGKAYFTSKFYNTTRNDIYRDVYNQEMRNSSVFWTATFCEYNQDQVEKHRPDFNKPKLNEVPHVSWWTIDNDVLAMGEYPNPVQVDPHIGINMNKSYDLGPLPDGGKHFNPAHQAYDETMGLISTIGITNYNKDSKILETKRVVYSVNKAEALEVKTEISYPDADLADCGKPEGVSSDKKLRYLHSIGASENYIVIPETSYLLEPCIEFDHQIKTNWYEKVVYDNATKGRFIIIPKTDPQNYKTFEANHHFFITHFFNAFERDGKIHVDVLKYENALVYEKHPLVAEAVYGEDRAQNKIMRYSMDFNDDEMKVEDKELIKQPDNTFVEFNNINPKYHGKPYKYGYAVRNVFGLHNAIVKFNFEDGTEEAYELPDGEFGTEPIFVPGTGENSTEDAGWVLVQTIDSIAEKANILILRAENMVPEFKAQAPELGLHGIHSGFFPFEVGCTLNDCVPEKSGANIDEKSAFISMLFSLIFVLFWQ